MATSTIITVTYKHYTENVIVNNEDQAQQLRNIIKNDEDFVSYEVVNQGDFVFNKIQDVKVEVKNIKRTRKINKYWHGQEVFTYKSATIYFSKGAKFDFINIPKLETWQCNEIINEVKALAKAGRYDLIQERFK
jgi:conjugal transfer/entry exclusion protein